MVSKDVFRRLACLSKLNFSDDEIKYYTDDLNSIISFADVLLRAQLKEVNILKNSLDKSSLREDLALDSYTQDLILKNSPNKSNGFFKVSGEGKSAR